MRARLVYAAKARAPAIVSARMEVTTSRASDAMSRYADGEDAAFETLYDELAPRLHAYLRRRVGDRADDALQQTFLQLHLHRGRFARGARVEPWAYAIARAVSTSVLRRDRRAPQDLSEEHPDESHVDASSLLTARELGEALAQELENVTPKLREAFLLVRLDGLTHAEAARLMETSEGTAKVRTHRVSQWLRSRLVRFINGEKK